MDFEKINVGEVSIYCIDGKKTDLFQLEIEKKEKYYIEGTLKKGNNDNKYYKSKLRFICDKDKESGNVHILLDRRKYIYALYLLNKISIDVSKPGNEDLYKTELYIKLIKDLIKKRDDNLFTREIIEILGSKGIAEVLGKDESIFNEKLEEKIDKLAFKDRNVLIKKINESYAENLKEKFEYRKNPQNIESILEYEKILNNKSKKLKGLKWYNSKNNYANKLMLKYKGNSKYWCSFDYIWQTKNKEGEIEYNSIIGKIQFFKLSKNLNGVLEYPNKGPEINKNVESEWEIFIYQNPKEESKITKVVNPHLNIKDNSFDTIVDKFIEFINNEEK